jgi:hypothetical protein
MAILFLISRLTAWPRMARTGEPEESTARPTGDFRESHPQAVLA